uniref:Uncharacterized protein n=1 Tax=Pristionchus pacificus TaxID=54126 RepID=A0A2A6CRD1_PRIPA|eukprot:PDM80603.1 hypothetical protein PRIPAC_35606 [Pristionchus pacificus]
MLVSNYHRNRRMQRRRKCDKGNMLMVAGVIIKYNLFIEWVTNQFELILFLGPTRGEHFFAFLGDTEAD